MTACMLARETVDAFRNPPRREPVKAPRRGAAEFGIRPSRGRDRTWILRPAGPSVPDGNFQVRRPLGAGTGQGGSA